MYVFAFLNVKPTFESNSFHADLIKYNRINNRMIFRLFEPYQELNCRNTNSHPRYQIVTGS